MRSRCRGCNEYNSISSKTKTGEDGEYLDTEAVKGSPHARLKAKTQGQRERLGKTLSRKVENGWMIRNPDKQVTILHISNLSSMATGIFLAHSRNLGTILEMRSSRPLAAVVPGTVDRVKQTYPGSASLEMSPSTLVVQDKGTNRTEEMGPLSPVTLIQLGATKIVKAPKIVDLALDEKPTSELTVYYVQTFGMKVDWKQDVLTALTARIQAVNPEVTILARYGKRVGKNEDTDQSTGFASMIIRVPQESFDCRADCIWTNKSDWASEWAQLDWRKQESASTTKTRDSTTATEEFRPGRLGPLDRCLTPRHHGSSQMRSGMIPLKVLPIKGRGVGQTGLLGAETTTSAGTHATEWQGLLPSRNDGTKESENGRLGHGQKKKSRGASPRQEPSKLTRC